MNSDFKDALRCLLTEDVRFLVVGGYAVIHYTEPRFTKGLDIWLDPTATNARLVAKAFHTFGIPLIDLLGTDIIKNFHAKSRCVVAPLREISFIG